MKVPPVNPVEKSLAHIRKRNQVVPNKKTKYNRNKDKVIERSKKQCQDL